MTATTSESSGAPHAQPPFILLKRPCLLIATFLIPGLIVGHYIFPGELTVWLLLPPAAFLLAALWLLAIHSTFSTTASMLVVFSVGLLLGVRSGLLPRRHAYFKLETATTYRLQGVVVSEPILAKRPPWPTRASTRRRSFTLKAKLVRDPRSKSGRWNPIIGKILVYTSAPPAARLQYGDKVELTGEAFLPDPRRNPGGFDFRKYLAHNGIHLCMRSTSIRTVARGCGNPIYQSLYSLKNKIRRTFSLGAIDQDRQSFLRAVILGEKRGVDVEFREALRRTGTMHILAISGLHVGIVAAALYFFLSRLLFVPHSISSLATIAVLFGYALLTGMRPPVLRASLMCTAFLMAPLLKRRLDAINSLAFAAVVILFIRPGDLFTAGFQLSFMVVFSILLLGNKIFHGFLSLFRLRPDPGFLTVSPFRRRVYRILECPLGLFSVALSAFLGSLPLTLFYFNRICFLSPFCNMLVIPLVGIIVPLGFLSGLLGLLTQGLAAFINTFNGQLIGALQTIVTSFPAAKIASFNVSPPSSAFCLVFYSGIFLVGFGRSFRRLIIPVAVIVVLAAGSFAGGEFARRHPHSIRITFLDVGQGDCIFVESPHGRKMLVDGGSTNHSHVGRYVIIPFLRWAGVNKLHAVLISHYDADHINGLQSVLENVKAGVVVVRAAPEPPHTAAVRDLLRLIEKKHIPIETVEAGDTLSFSDRFTGTIANPPPAPEASRLSENDASVVLKLQFCGPSVLLSGDIQKRAERLILRRPTSLRSEVLKVPHHGSNSSSSDEFIRHVAPRVAVISCGLRNIYGHPSPKVIQRYHQLGVRLFRTDRHGGIVIRLSCDKLTVTTTL